MDKPRRVQVIINPVAGKDQPILKILNAAMQTAGVDWDVSITKEAGDGFRLAQEAVQAGADVVAVHGGDGTIMEVATGLMGSEVPLAIIPGGTANVMAMELGLSTDLVEACALAVNPDATIRMLDMGRIGEIYFLLRAGMGIQAAMVEGTNRELKERLGVLAYGLAALQALADPPRAHYDLSLDGLEVDCEGLTCIIANSGTIGAPGILLSPDVNVSDGLLDVFVLRKADLSSLLSLAARMATRGMTPPDLLHWQVRKVTVASDPVQTVQADGELIGQTPITVDVVPRAARVIVPQTGDVPGEDVYQAP